MISCEDAYLLADWVQSVDDDSILGVGPVPVSGEDQSFADGFTIYAEKAPNARGVQRALSAFGKARKYDKFLKEVAGDDCRAVIITGNYPSDWVTDDLLEALEGRFAVLIDTLESALAERADVVLPGATFAEKSGTFENVGGRLQAFERAIRPIDFCKSEAQIALDLASIYAGDPGAAVFNPANTRARMADIHGLKEFLTDVAAPAAEHAVESDMAVVEL